jgi:hypothetical protein
MKTKHKFLTNLKQNLNKLGDKVFDTPSTVITPSYMYEGVPYQHTVTRCCVVHLIADGKHTETESKEIINIYSQSYVDSLVTHIKALELAFTAKDKLNEKERI